MVVLKNLEELEGKLADFYGGLSDKFADDTDAKSFFYRMSLEEKSHKDIVNYQQRTVRKNKDIFADVDVDLGAIKTLLNKIASFKNSDLPIAETLRFCLEIEKSIAESYIFEAMRQSNKEFAGFLSTLSKTFHEHHKELTDFAKKYSSNS